MSSSANTITQNRTWKRLWRSAQTNPSKENCRTWRPSWRSDVSQDNGEGFNITAEKLTANFLPEIRTYKWKASTLYITFTKTIHSYWCPKFPTKPCSSPLWKCPLSVWPRKSALGRWGHPPRVRWKSLCWVGLRKKGSTRATLWRRSTTIWRTRRPKWQPRSANFQSKRRDHASWTGDIETPSASSASELDFYILVVLAI